MTIFLTATAVLAAVTLGLIMWPLFVRGRAAESRDVKDMRLYRDQLAEVERDLERGVVGIAEAEGAKAEISRRIIAAAGRSEGAAGIQTAPGTATGLAAGLALVAVPLVAGMVYLSGGAPGVPDMPFAARGLEPTIDTARQGGMQRLGQQNAETMVAEARGPLPEPSIEEREFAALIEQVEGVMETRGPDVQGLTLLANGYARLGRHAEAWRAYHRLIQEMGSEAGADLYALQAEAMVMAADGYVSPEARQVLGEALQRNPAQPLARYFTGLALAQQGDRDGAVALWQGLRDEAEDGSPWAGALDNMIAEVTGATAPAPAPGPSAEDMAAAADMTPEEREQMIEGMVQRLETRLAAEGGAPEEWLRLMTAYRQLGRMDDARRAYAMGSDALEGGEASFLRQQALVMGIIEE